ncbi:hypothetical protein EYZ11_008525 [Aspergillus tanneri]|uniref:Uncharacterized protein n=1 Tax=Aspergillus tanneri TaxID=1220188 RepID=A0A4S3JAC4_9EURO|nr:hypothetical protein EYZ11_008525 [Aspergillus tanneri]
MSALNVGQERADPIPTGPDIETVLQTGPIPVRSTCQALVLESIAFPLANASLAAFEQSVTCDEEGTGLPTQRLPRFQRHQIKHHG